VTAPLGVLAAVLPLDVPITIGREEAQRLARLELAKPEYARDDQTLVQRAISWLVDRINDVLDAATHSSPLGWFGLLGLALVLALVVVAVRRRTGALGRASNDAALFDVGLHSAADYRAAAERYAESGAWAEAVRARLRAVVRDLEERGLVDARPGRTADEIASEAGIALPSVAVDLRSGARAFDDVWYGGRLADAGTYDRLVAVDRAVAAARPGGTARRGDLAPAAPR
jgi:hypothetical protein